MPGQPQRRPQFRPSPPAAPLPWWRAELPFAMLVLAAIAAPACVLDQGGTWHDALFSACVVLGLPGAAVESVTGAARIALQLRGSV